MEIFIGHGHVKFFHVHVIASVTLLAKATFVDPFQAEMGVTLIWHFGSWHSFDNKRVLLYWQRLHL
jgi:hypothetical protein